ncbi:MAG: molybdopterin-synthase adenylyltransferase MoeB [Gammaproteobacteria bacterium]|nr:molybdopterin-synthase adenylyltransferase MoeB [Gammaproteobacteria bacterium]
MDELQLQRYSRQIMLPEIGVDGQQRLLSSRVLVVGLGGLGSPVIMYLAASGVGHLVMSDYDIVDLSNLQRQIAHTTPRVDALKVDSAQQALRALNPDIKVTTHGYELEQDALLEEVRLADAVVDATDNFPTRFELNRACALTSTPLISGAAIQLEGQVSVFRLDRPNSPCYRCLYTETDAPGERCGDVGILGSVVGIIGTIQATETIKVLLNIGEDLDGRLLMLDARTMEWRTGRLRKDPACPVCAMRTASHAEQSLRAS